MVCALWLALLSLGEKKNATSGEKSNCPKIKYTKRTFQKLHIIILIIIRILKNLTRQLGPIRTKPQYYFIKAVFFFLFILCIYYFFVVLIFFALLSHLLFRVSFLFILKVHF